MIGWENERSLPSVIIGVILVLWGLIPWLNTWGVIGFNLPAIFLTLPTNILLWILSFGGLFLIVDTFWGGEDDFWWWTSFAIGGVVLIAGLIELLSTFNIIGFGMPGFLTVEVFYILFIVEGFTLFVAAFQQ